MMTRKEFLEEVMRRANLRDLKQADEATRAVISLTKLIIGPKLSQKIAKISPPDLREGWESIKPAFPQKPIKIITGSGGEDADIREIAPLLKRYFGVDILIENIGGFWGKVPFEKFHVTEADGYTLICYTFPRSLIIEIMTQANYRTIEFTPVFAWAVGNQFLLVSPDRYKTFGGFLAEGKIRTLKCSIPLVSGITHLTGILIAKGLGINVEWIPFEGSASSIAAVSRKEVDFTISLSNTVISWIKTGKIKPIALLPDRRYHQYNYFSDIPTLRELGYEIDQITIRHVIEAPPNTPLHIVRILEDAFNKAVKENSYLKWAKSNYVIINPLSKEEFLREVEETYKKIEEVKEMLKSS